jgi:hypothetical protein
MTCIWHLRSCKAPPQGAYTYVYAFRSWRAPPSNTLDLLRWISMYEGLLYDATSPLMGWVDTYFEAFIITFKESSTLLKSLEHIPSTFKHLFGSWEWFWTFFTLEVISMDQGGGYALEDSPHYHWSVSRRLVHLCEPPHATRVI